MTIANKFLAPILFVIVYFPMTISAQKTNTTRSSTEIVASNNATHIGKISKDTITVISGSTYAFTVDTPEDSGLVKIRTTLPQLVSNITAPDGSALDYTIHHIYGSPKDEYFLVTGDKLDVRSKDGKSKKTYTIVERPMAIGGQLQLERKTISINSNNNLVLYFTAGQRTPNATVKIYIPAGINITEDNTTVNVIGRGNVKLKDLATQSIGRVGTNYPYHKVGNFSITKLSDGSSLLLFKHLDLRPANGADLKIVISNIAISKAGQYLFSANYSTTKPEVFTSGGIGSETTILSVTNTVSDFERIADKNLQYKESRGTYTTVNFKWGSDVGTKAVQLLQSMDQGRNWSNSAAAIDVKRSNATITGLTPNQWYKFKLLVKDGIHKGASNMIYYYSGKLDIKDFGVTADSNTDNTVKINDAIEYLHSIGGGTLLFSEGIYNVRTVHLKSNVYLYVNKGATIRAIKGADAPETTWFSDKKYRSGLSPTDAGPYADPENYMTKQDVGHHYFYNSMFYGERIDNVKIIGNGYITGNGNLVTGDNVMKNAPDNRCDKMFTLKLCTNLEIGGLYRADDLWYDSTKDEPYYINKDGSKDFAIGNMLHIDRTGHFALLATGTDNINVHDTYFGKKNNSNTRDIYDFMQCNNITATNIYCKVTSDDIIKPGSDCSLGFTRPATNYKVRNIIGDTNCNLFQIGSETADDITDVHVDNIYILGANKAGFSISTNDGAHIKDIHLNCGHTGPLHSRSKMYRSFSPFFISISNRGRIIGASASRFKFDENGTKHDELLVTNVNIGEVENIIINGIDVFEVYAGSSFGGKSGRWKAYDGSQKRATPIIAGYRLPDDKLVDGGLNFKLPNGKHTGYIKNISFNDVNFLVKGGNPLADTAAMPPELGVGQYNVSNLKIQPSYGLWARHVIGFTVNKSSFNFEQTDNRYALFLDDVIGAKISGIKMIKAKDINAVVKFKNSSDINIENAVYYDGEWGKAVTILPSINQTVSSNESFPNKKSSEK